MMQKAENVRLLVAITCYGSKNEELLRQLIRQYQAMAFDVDVVVLSNVPRDLGPRVRVIVGMPSSDPWSLPFAHKAVFAENVLNYDLFAYSEDDMGVSERNIRAFLQLSPFLESNEIAGFLRYEVDEAGTKSLPDAHGGYHWKPDSVRKRGEFTVAEFTNEHAAFYLVTQKQLAAMIEQDGFVREPYEGWYDMACTAATDPYTAYSYRKVVCISDLDDFLIHHLSNRYSGEMGISLESMSPQIQALADIADGDHVAADLFDIQARWPDGQWAKNFYARPQGNVLDLVPTGTKSLLSIGCGWGMPEARLAEQGLEVTAVPMNSVVLPPSAHPGVHVVHGSIEECMDKLEPRRFDCVMVCDLLHLLPDPQLLVQSCSRLVNSDGALVLSGTNFESLKVRLKRVLDKGGYRKLRSYAQSGLTLVGPGSLKANLSGLGFNSFAIRWCKGTEPTRCGRWNAANWALQAQREANTSRIGASLQ